MFSKKHTFTFKPKSLALALMPICLTFSNPVFSVVDFVVNQKDFAGEGFKDTTPFSSVGGNPATTLGEARYVALQYAAHLWGGRLTSTIKIEVDAQFDPLPCTTTQAALGMAGAGSVHRDFPNAPKPNTWYPQALANSLAKQDLVPTMGSISGADITATFSSALNGSPSCLGGTQWYYGLDGKPPAGYIDFVTVALHELAHGLGFQTFVNLSSGIKFNGLDDAFMLNLEHSGATPSSYSSMTNVQRVTASISDPNLLWTGSEVSSSIEAKTAGKTSGKAQMYAPNPQELGSSVSHFSTTV